MSTEERIARIEGSFTALQEDVREVKTDVRDLREGQHGLHSLLTEVRVSLAQLSDNPTTPVGADSTALMYVKWLAYGCIIIAVGGVTGIISVHLDEIGAVFDLILRAKEVVTLDGHV